MISKSEIRFAARLVHLGLVGRADMQSALSDLERQRRHCLESSLDDVLVERGHITASEIPLLQEDGKRSRPVHVCGYRILEELGQGGMSRVYRARPRTGGRPVALKILHPHIARRPLQVRCFHREADLLIRFEHPNLVKGLRVWESEGLHCFTMELVDGTCIQDRIAAGHRYEESAALAVVLQVARALAYLSRRGITHRDVKPGNLLEGADGRVTLIDLGLARSVEAGPVQPPGTTVGTVQYVSPEQACGAADLDVRADIYSLGVSLYQMVLGDVPFSGASDREILRQQVSRSLQSPRTRDRRVTPHLHYFIEKMMAKDRALRYQHPDELIRDIEDNLRGRAEILGRVKAPPPRKRPPEAPARRGRARDRRDRR
ncbi:MAG: serine/threonine protein kinase [Planctomycetes bacterium]|nr:serine/threonine protein kinase [Planctomycetota bacterium]